MLASAVRAADSVRPVVGAAAMSLGIVSIALHLAGADTLSLIALALGVAVWAALAGVVTSRLLEDRDRWAAESRTPTALTGVAATCVLGTRVCLLGWHPVAAVALVAAAAAWVVLVPSVLRGWTTPTVGAHFLLCVATQAPAVLGATLAATTGHRWLLIPAAAFFVLGLCCYLFVAARFPVRELAVGAGDHWVSAGALAISSLAGAKIVLAADAAEWWGGAVDAMRTAALVLEIVELGAYLVLVGCEVRWPRLRFDPRRWSTVFPMGMTAVAAITVADATGLSALRWIGLTLVWPAVALCVVMLIASGRRLWVVGRT